MRRTLKQLIRWFSEICDFSLSFFMGGLFIGNLTVVHRYCDLKKKRLVIYSYFSKEKSCPGYVTFAVNSIKKMINADVIFANNSPRNACRGKASEMAEWEIVTRNLGRDFGAWKVALDVLGPKQLRQYSSILLTNDSIYGPFFDICPFVEQIENSISPTLGALTDTWSPRYHLQSYFLVFNQKAIHTHFFEQFWKNVRFINGRRFIVEQYEIPLTQQALRKGINLVSFCSASEVRLKGMCRLSPELKKRARSSAVNPTHYFWRALLEDFRVPFVKRDLLTQNPENVHDLSDLPLLISNCSSYNCELIFDDLKRNARNGRVF